MKYHCNDESCRSKSYYSELSNSQLVWVLLHVDDELKRRGIINQEMVDELSSNERVMSFSAMLEKFVSHGGAQ